MHFVGFVIGEDVDAALAPFDENRDVEPYREEVSLDEVGRAIAYFAEHPDQCAFPGPTVADVALAKAGNGESILKVLKGWKDGSDVGQDDDGYFTMSTYNPEGHWDWWVIGGRWRGFFLLREEAKDKALVGEPGTGEFLALRDGTPPLDYSGKADQARKRDIDFAQMRRFAELAADHTYDLFEQHFASKVGPEALAAHKPWSAFVEEAKARGRAVGNRGYPSDEDRALYHAQPLCEVVRAYRAETFEDRRREQQENQPTDPDAQTLTWMDVDRPATLGRERFVKEAGDQAFMPYFEKWDRTRSDGGEFVEFEHQDSTPAGMTWEKYVIGLIETLPEDAQITVVDCHS